MPGVVYYDPACPIKDIVVWQKAICCKRCYDFKDAYSKTKRAIEKLSVALISLQQMRDEDAKKEAKNEIRERLVKLTKRLATICSDYYRVQNIWDMEVVRIIMDKPDGCNRAVNVFRAGYEKAA